MVIAYHLIWTAYGWWLPNDPRGSESQLIASDVIAELGTLHRGRKRVQPASRELRAFYEIAADVLKFPLARFSFLHTRLIAEAFASAIAWEKYTCYACAIMPDHIHMLIRKHRDLAEQMIAKLQACTKERLLEVDPRYFGPNHPVWGGPGWKVFLNEPADIRRTVKYIEDNPLKARIPEQHWNFVTTYDGWPFHKRSTL